MERIECHELINKPLQTVYNQWTQFEEFPSFMKGIKSVEQLDATHLHWRAEIGGKDVEWDAEIIDQVPDQRIVWRSTSGPNHGGKVEFQAEDSMSTTISLVMEYDPRGGVENLGDALGFTSHRMQDDLRNFKHFIESSPSETGGWRKEVHRRQVEGNE